MRYLAILIVLLAYGYFCMYVGQLRCAKTDLYAVRVIAEEKEYKTRVRAPHNDSQLYRACTMFHSEKELFRCQCVIDKVKHFEPLTLEMLEKEDQMLKSSRWSRCDQN